MKQSGLRVIRRCANPRCPTAGNGSAWYTRSVENVLAADCYRKVADFIRQQPDGFEAGAVDEYAARAAKLDPPTTT